MGRSGSSTHAGSVGSGSGCVGSGSGRVGAGSDVRLAAVPFCALCRDTCGRRLLRVSFSTSSFASSRTRARCHSELRRLDMRSVRAGLRVQVERVASGAWNEIRIGTRVGVEKGMQVHARVYGQRLGQGTGRG